MTRYEIVNAAGQVAYNIPAANQEEAEAASRKLCAKSGVPVTVRVAAVQGVPG